MTSTSTGKQVLADKFTPRFMGRSGSVPCSADIHRWN